jgi:hypothetical protein
MIGLMASEHKRRVWTKPANTELWLYSNHLNGSLWEDQSGEGNDATLYSATLSEADGIYTDGSKYATVGEGPAIGTGGILCAWIKPDSVSGNPLFVSTWDSTEYMLATYGTTGAAGYNNHQAGKSASLAASTWAHVALLYDGSNMMVYVDGVLGQQVASTSTSVTRGITIGRQNSGASLKYAGYIDDIMIVTSGGDEDMILDIMDNSPGSHA